MKNKFRIVNKKLNLSFSKYIDAMDEFVNKIKKFKEIISIYQIGEINAPGSSDIDLIVVTKDKISNFEDINTTENEVISRHSTVFIHGVWYFGEKTFEKIKLLLPIFSIKKIYGKKINIEVFNETNVSIIHLNTVLNSNGKRLYQEFLNKNNTSYLSKISLMLDALWPSFFDNFRIKVINERGLLNRVNGSKYETKLLKNIHENIKDSEIKHMLTQYDKKHKKFTQKRQKWDEISNKATELENEIKSEVIKTNQVITFFYKILRKNIVSIDAPNNILLVNYPRINLYIKNWSADKSNKLSKKYFKLTGRIISVLPQEFLVQLLYVKNVESLINNNKINFKFHHKLSKLLIEQRNIISTYYDYCDINKIPPISFSKFGKTNRKQRFVNKIIFNKFKNKLN
jgi:hypothetical protein